MATTGNMGPIEIKFSPEARRQIERLTRALEKIAKSQSTISFTNTNPDGGLTPEDVARTADARYVYRDAVTGNYVDEDYALAHPDTTVKENVT